MRTEQYMQSLLHLGLVEFHHLVKHQLRHRLHIAVCGIITDTDENIVRKRRRLGA